MRMQNDIPNLQNTADSVITLENLIKSYLLQIEEAKDEAKRLKEMYADYLTNHEVFSATKEKADEATKTAKQARQAALATPEAQATTEKLNMNKEKLNDLKNKLSDTLLSYERASGANTIEVGDGDIRQIIYTAKLAKAL